MKLILAIFRNTLLLTVVAGSTNLLVAQAPQSKLKTDTNIVVVPTKDIEISMEVKADKGTLVRIINSSNNIDVRTWAEGKVKIVSTISVLEQTKVGSGEEMFERAGVIVRSANNRVEINATSSGTFTAVGRPTAYSTLSNLQGTTTSTSSNVTRVITTTSSKKRTLTIYVPETAKLNIENKSSDIIFRNNFKEVKLTLSNSNVDCQNITDLSLFAKYSIVNVGDVEDAEVEFQNGTFRASNIKNLDIDSKSSTIEYDNGNNIYMRSERDNFIIENLKKVEGRKLYGELRIDKLYSILDIEGANADIKVRNIMPEVEKIKLNNRYADIRLPIKSLQNYSVSFEGNHSTVFAPFEKVEVKDEKRVTEVKTDDKKGTNGVGVATTPTASTVTRTATPVIGQSSTIYAAAMGQKAPAKFTASVGDTKSKRTKFELICHSCTVDFK